MQNALCAILILLCIIYFIFKSGSSNQITDIIRKVKKLEKEVGELKARLQAMDNQQQGKPMPEPAAVESESIADREAAVPAMFLRQEPPAPAEVEEASVPEAAVPAPDRARPLEKFSEIFIRNWTGILGSVFMVMGIGFLGIYTALKCSPFNRFVMITGFSLFLTILFAVLNKREKWVKLALWLRSSAGALFLFACLGAGGIPGLQWITDPGQALALLAAGIAVNVFLGYAGKKQLFASLHLLLSLVALAIAPQSLPILSIASVVTVVSILLTVREKWEHHLLLAVSSYFAYHFYWYFEAGGRTLAGMDHAAAIICVGLVGVSALLIHYRGIYRHTSFEPMPFVVHLLNWFFFAINLTMHATDVVWKPFIIAAGALAAFAFARVAKKREIRWLFVTDTLVAQVTALIAIAAMSRWEVDGFFLAGMMFVETIVFSVIVRGENEKALYKTGAGIAAALLAGLALYSMGTVDYTNSARLIKHSVTLFVCALVLAVDHIYIFRRYQDNVDAVLHSLAYSGKPGAGGPNFSLLEFLAGLALLAASLHLCRFVWFGYAAAAAGIPFLLVRQKYQSNGLGLGMVSFIIGAHLLAWQRLNTTADWDVMVRLVYCLPFFALSYAAAAWSFVAAVNRRVRWIGIYLFFAQLGAAAYFTLNALSPFIPAIIWLCLSVAALEAAAWVRGRPGYDAARNGEPDRYLLHCGYAAIAGFLLRHVLVHLQSEASVSGIPVRLAVSVFALAMFFFWAMAKHPSAGKVCRSWVYLHPLFVELIAGFVALTIAVELDAKWHQVAWAAMALASLGVGSISRLGLPRLRVYALFFGAASAVELAFISSLHVTPSLRWYEQAWLSGCIAIGLQLVYICFAHRSMKLGDIAFYPRALQFLSGPVQGIWQNRNLYLYNPLFFCIAVFLYCSFDKALLTLLWVAECFIVFVLSIMLKENNFRYLSFLGLIACSLRLLAYDLAKSETLTRALAFLGVGVLMLIMNSLYNKYKDAA